VACVGSNPTPSSTRRAPARAADATVDLRGSDPRSCRFESDAAHHRGIVQRQNYRLLTGRSRVQFPVPPPIKRRSARWPSGPLIRDLTEVRFLPERPRRPGRSSMGYRLVNDEHHPMLHPWAHHVCAVTSRVSRQDRPPRSERGRHKVRVLGPEPIPAAIAQRHSSSAPTRRSGFDSRLPLHYQGVAQRGPERPARTREARGSNPRTLTKSKTQAVRAGV
jgi:hypothetical protein